MRNWRAIDLTLQVVLVFNAFLLTLGAMNYGGIFAYLALAAFAPVLSYIPIKIDGLERERRRREKRNGA